MFLHVSLVKGTQQSYQSPCLRPKLVYVGKEKNFDFRWNLDRTITCYLWELIHQMSFRMCIRKWLEKVIVLASDFIQQKEKFHSTNGKKANVEMKVEWWRHSPCSWHPVVFPLHGVSYISGDDSAITQKRTLIHIPPNCNLSSYLSLEHVC